MTGNTCGIKSEGKNLTYVKKGGNQITQAKIIGAIVGIILGAGVAILPPTMGLTGNAMIRLGILAWASYTLFLKFAPIM